jgi:hypothetical protein
MARSFDRQIYQLVSMACSAMAAAGRPSAFRSPRGFAVPLRQGRVDRNKSRGRGQVGLKYGSDEHRGVLLALANRRIRSRWGSRKTPRTGSGGQGDNLNADVRPCRIDAAAASGEHGREVDHARRYKAGAVFRQANRRHARLNPDAVIDAAGDAGLSCHGLSDGHIAVVAG